jgi:hypothetical protein
MNKKMAENLIYNLCTSIVLILSFVGNTFGIFVMNRKELLKIGPIKMYKYLFIVNLIFSLFILDNFVLNTSKLGFSIISSYTCKLYRLLMYPVIPLTPIIMVYIMLERYLSIKYPVESNFMRKNTVQIIYFFTLIIFNFILFSYVPFNSDIEVINNSTIRCEITSLKYKRVSYLIFSLTNLVPFILILIFSILLVSKIITSRSHLNTFYTPRENLIFKKDVKISFMIILTNLITIILFAFIIFIHYYHLNFGLFSYNEIIILRNIFYLHYVGHFYYFLITNSMFRKGFYYLICCKKSNINNSN